MAKFKINNEENSKDFGIPVYGIDYEDNLRKLDKWFRSHQREFPLGLRVKIVDGDKKKNMGVLFSLTPPREMQLGNFGNVVEIDQPYNAFRVELGSTAEAYVSLVKRVRIQYKGDWEKYYSGRYG